jgi:hypothetical protein
VAGLVRPDHQVSHLFHGTQEGGIGQQGLLYAEGFLNLLLNRIHHS